MHYFHVCIVSFSCVTALRGKDKVVFYYDATSIIWAASWQKLFLAYANDKGADQPAHPRSLISTFVVRCLDSIISLVSISEIPRLQLASVAEQAGLSLFENPEDRFSRDEAHLSFWLFLCIFVITYNVVNVVQCNVFMYTTHLIEPRHEKTCLREFPTRPDTNRPVQPQKLARVLKFRL